MERELLASTVRLEWHFWYKDDFRRRFLEGNTGYATVKEERYLVTHNHPGKSLSDLAGDELVTLSVYTSNGHPILVETPLEMITIIVEEAETLVLDFGDRQGHRLFTSMDLTSVEFMPWDKLTLRPGMEVAQIDWDGTMAHVDWVTIDDIITDGGTPRVELANFVKRGASGGGVFWNGYHIANTWSRVTTFEEDSGKIVRRYSVAALNSTRVTTSLQPLAAASP